MHAYGREEELKEDYNYFEEDIDKNIFNTDNLALYPLYRSINVNNMMLGEVFPISKTCVDLFCKKCMTRRKFTFSSLDEDILVNEEGRCFEKIDTRDGSVERLKKVINENTYFEFNAKGDCGHVLYMLFEVVAENIVRKIGQTPSPEELNENLNKPSIKMFLEMYNRPMYEFEINRIEDEKIKKIKKKTFDEVNIYNELEVKNKISRYECNKSKNCIYEKEKNILVNYYNMKYNLPYGLEPESGKEIALIYFDLGN